MIVLIIEDEVLAATQLEQYIKGFDPSVQFLPLINSIKGLRLWLLKSEVVDLIFCDIELSDGNVLETLANQSLPAPVVFTTAYDHFWNQALKLNGIEYLLKPLDSDSVHRALQKIEAIRSFFNQEKAVLSRIAKLVGLATPSYKKRFPVRVGNELFVLETDMVSFFRITDGVIFAYLENGKRYPLEESTITELEATVNPVDFFRINRSEIVNSRAIASIKVAEGGGYVIHLRSLKEVLVVSGSRSGDLKQWLRSQ